MRFATTLSAILAVALPAFSLPSDASARQDRLSACAADTCLTSTNGLFDGCAPNDFPCLCSQEQSELTRYVATVQPCIDGEAGQKACTPGGIYTYKDALKQICASPQFQKQAIFPPGPNTPPT